MNQPVALACISILLTATTALAANAPVPCEQMLSDVKAALPAAKLTDAAKAKVTDLENKAIDAAKLTMTLALTCSSRRHWHSSLPKIQRPYRAAAKR